MLTAVAFVDTSKASKFGCLCSLEAFSLLKITSVQPPKLVWDSAYKDVLKYRHLCIANCGQVNVIPAHVPYLWNADTLDMFLTGITHCLH